MSELADGQKKGRLGRRWQPRRKAHVACHRGVSDLRPDVALSLLDISETGARLVSREDLPPGQRVFLVLAGPAADRPVRRLGTVAWSVAAADGTFCVGVRLQERLGAESLRHLAWV